MRIFGTVFLSILMTAASGRAQASGGVWIDLLADQSLSNWTRVPLPSTASLAPVSPWKYDAAAGVLVCEGGKAGHEFFRYEREFADFILHVEWRFTKVEGEPRYNSGIYVRNNADGTIWHQAQTGNASGGFIFGDTLVNGVKQRVNLSKEIKDKRVKPAGEWNTFEIRAAGRDLQLTVNGGLTSEFTSCEVPRGYVGLEAEGYRIEFRSVRLKELP